MIPEIARLPDISFIGDTTLEGIENKLIADYEAKFLEETGLTVSLKDGEPIALMLKACAVQLYQMYLSLNKAGRMNFLKYAYGDYLDNLGALKGVERQGAKAAGCTVKFSLSVVRPSVVAIPEGTRVTTQSGGMYFATDEYCEIPIGSENVTVHCTAVTAGEEGNGIGIGEISVIVDPVAYVASVTNLTATSGGTGEESDESLADRIYLAPAHYSVAGPRAAYEYFTKTAYPSIADVSVTSPDECEVDIRVIGPNGTLLSADVLQEIEDYLNQSDIKPMTDLVTVGSPSTESYTVNITYYIAKSDISSVSSIQAAVTQAVSDYVVWQQSKIGRDIEPSKLVEFCMAAGAKRVTVTAPSAHTAVAATDIAKISGTPTITYGGVEDD